MITSGIKRLIAWAAPALALLLFGSYAHAAACDPNSMFCNILAWDSFQDFIAGVLKAVVMIAIPLITLAFVLVGFQYIWAQGNLEDLKKAHKNFVAVVTGSLLIMGAWTIATLIAGTVVSLMRPS